MQHESVMLKPAVDFLVQNSSGAYLDCTGGLGGHAAEILTRLNEHGRLWICDYHQKTVERLQQRFAVDARVTILCSRFSQIFDKLNLFFDGIIVDLGISSPQLEDPELGIGFLVNDAPLDMRLDATLSATAADLLETTPEEKLADIFYRFGGETASRKLAKAVVDDRHQGKLYQTTSAFRDLCARVLGRFYRGKRIHPATKAFQALRIAVNRELEELATLLAQAPQRLNVRGRLCIIAFHSGEDRLVKNTFRELTTTDQFSRPVRKVLKPEREEIEKNPRARSARLRILEKVT